MHTYPLDVVLLEVDKLGHVGLAPAELDHLGGPVRRRRHRHVLRDVVHVADVIDLK